MWSSGRVRGRKRFAIVHVTVKKSCFLSCSQRLHLLQFTNPTTITIRIQVAIVRSGATKQCWLTCVVEVEGPFTRALSTSTFVYFSPLNKLAPHLVSHLLLSFHQLCVPLLLLYLSTKRKSCRSLRVALTDRPLYSMFRNLHLRVNWLTLNLPNGNTVKRRNTSEYSTVRSILLYIWLYLSTMGIGDHTVIYERAPESTSVPGTDARLSSLLLSSTETLVL